MGGFSDFFGIVIRVDGLVSCEAAGEVHNVVDEASEQEGREEGDRDSD